MAKKKIKKTSTLSGRKARTKSVSYTRYLLIGFSVLLLGLFVKVSTRPADKPFVLGTSVYLATEGENTGTQSTETIISKPTEPNTIYPTPRIRPEPEAHEGLNTEHPEKIYVDCVGPDGKHFLTNLKACSDLNHSFGHDHFSFTVLKPNAERVKPANSIHPDSTSSARLMMPHFNPGEKNKLTILHADLRKKLENKNARIELRSGDGTTSAKIKMPDGTETDLDEQQAFDEINSQLDDLGIDIAKSNSNNFSIKKNNVEARTKLPISINPDTKELTVTTPAGVRTVTVLPDEAVQRAFLTGKINSAESKSQTASSSGQTTDQTTLTTLNNEAVFKVNGFSNKKALGFVPVSFAKTVFVSATDGKIIRTDETFFSKLLETISF